MREPANQSLITDQDHRPRPQDDQEIVMLIHPTVERLRALGLAAMADTLIELQNNPQAAEMPHADWPGLLCVCAANERHVVARSAPYYEDFGIHGWRL
jgi:hypothetical protein